MKKIVDYVQSFITIALLLAGIGGFFWNVFKKDGWGGTLLSKFWDAQISNPVVAIPVTIGVVFVLKMWYDHNRAKGHTSRLPDVLVYVIMALGAYFIWQFWRDGF